jgi:hypothetical protein
MTYPHGRRRKCVGGTMHYEELATRWHKLTLNVRKKIILV